jgi:hypothetical protein
MDSMLSLLCYVRGGTVNDAFEVKIGNGEIVATLKKAIKEEISDNTTFRDVKARSLMLWRVSIPLDDSIEDDIENLNLDHKNSLRPNVILSGLFPDGLERGLIHIVVANPVAGEPQHYSALMYHSDVRSSFAAPLLCAWQYSHEHLWSRNRQRKLRRCTGGCYQGEEQ